MKIFKNIVTGYVFYTAPLILLLLVCFIIKKPDTDFHQIDTYEMFVLILFLHCVIWSLVSLGLTISMFFSKNLRNTVLARLSGMKERDEREVQIVGKALKSSYLTTMTILLCLLSISFIQITFAKKSPANLGPRELSGSISLGFYAEFSDPEALVTKKDGYDIYFQYNDVPLSTSSLVIFLLIWQIASYRYVSRRALRLPEGKDTE